MPSEMLRHPCHSSTAITQVGLLPPYTSSIPALTPTPYLSCSFIVAGMLSEERIHFLLQRDLDEFQQELMMAANLLGCRDPVQNHLHPTVAMG